MWKTQPYASIAMHGNRCHAARPPTTEINRKAPQTNTSTATDTEIRCASSAPNSRNRTLNIRSKRIFVVWLTITSPCARPVSINWASHALYMWLDRSPACTRGCQ